MMKELIPYKDITWVKKLQTISVKIPKIDWTFYIKGGLPLIKLISMVDWLRQCGWYLKDVVNNKVIVFRVIDGHYDSVAITYTLPWNDKKQVKTYAIYKNNLPEILLMIIYSLVLLWGKEEKKDLHLDVVNLIKDLEQITKKRRSEKLN